MQPANPLSNVRHHVKQPNDHVRFVWFLTPGRKLGAVTGQDGKMKLVGQNPFIGLLLKLCAERHRRLLGRLVAVRYWAVRFLKHFRLRLVSLARSLPRESSRAIRRIIPSGPTICLPPCVPALYRMLPATIPMRAAQPTPAGGGWQEIKALSDALPDTPTGKEKYAMAVRRRYLTPNGAAPGAGVGR